MSPTSSLKNPPWPQRDCASFEPDILMTRSTSPAQRLHLSSRRSTSRGARAATREPAMLRLVWCPILLLSVGYRHVSPGFLFLVPSLLRYRFAFVQRSFRVQRALTDRSREQRQQLSRSS